MDTRGGAIPRTLPASRSSLLSIIATGLIAFLVRAAPYFVPGQILGVREYDDGVMLGAAIALLAGELPYRDFVYAHPPGSILAIVVPAASSWAWGEPVAMAIARIGMILVGSANAVLLGLLLRRWGWFAVAVGAGAYALWPVVVSTEQTLLLEPILNFALLGSLLLLRRRDTFGVVAAGVFLALAVTVKVWAVVDVGVIAVVVAVVFGGRMLARYLVAVVATAVVVCLPFFLAAPLAMWEEVVVAQLVRAGTPMSLLGRAQLLSLTGGVHAIDQRIPAVVWLGFVIALVAVASSPLVMELRRRRSPQQWHEASWWAVILLAHLTVLIISRGFFYHYAAWLVAPLCLSLGWALAQAPRRVGRWLRPATIVVLVGVLVADISGTIRHSPGAVRESAPLAEWAQTRTCIWGRSSELIAADALRRNLSHGCAFDIDSFAAFLTVDQAVSRVTDEPGESRVWRERQVAFMRSADGVTLDGTGDPPGWLALDGYDFEDQFEKVDSFDGIGVWNRAGS